MKVQKLEIRHADRWNDNEKGKAYVGLVTMVGENGRQEIMLGAATIAKVFNLIRDDAIATAKANALLVKAGLEDAEAAPLLLEQMAAEE